MTPEFEFKVGDKVRSYNFPTMVEQPGSKSYSTDGDKAGDDIKFSEGQPNLELCYVEGTIVEIGLFDLFSRDRYRYRITTEKRIWRGEEIPSTPKFVFPPAVRANLKHCNVFGGQVGGVVAI